jgi:hypothetical protein
LLRGGVIFQKPNARGSSVGDPEVKIAVEIPVHGGEPPAVVGKAETGQGRDVGKLRLPASGIEKGAVPLASTESAIFMEESAECSPALLVGCNGVF